MNHCNDTLRLVTPSCKWISLHRNESIAEGESYAEHPTKRGESGVRRAIRKRNFNDPFLLEKLLIRRNGTDDERRETDEKSTWLVASSIPFLLHCSLQACWACRAAMPHARAHLHLVRNAHDTAHTTHTTHTHTRQTLTRSTASYESYDSERGA